MQFLNLFSHPVHSDSLNDTVIQVTPESDIVRDTLMSDSDVGEADLFAYITEKCEALKCKAVILPNNFALLVRAWIALSPSIAVYVVSIKGNSVNQPTTDGLIFSIYKVEPIMGLLINGKKENPADAGIAAGGVNMGDSASTDTAGGVAGQPDGNSSLYIDDVIKEVDGLMDLLDKKCKSVGLTELEHDSINALKNHITNITGTQPVDYGSTDTISDNAVIGDLSVVLF